MNGSVVVWLQNILYMMLQCKTVFTEFAENNMQGKICSVESNVYLLTLEGMSRLYNYKSLKPNIAAYSITDIVPCVLIREVLLNEHLCN
jgi:hypothetical protein